MYIYKIALILFMINIILYSRSAYGKYEKKPWHLIAGVIIILN